jgi:RNA polymerase sigma-70 factor, ECF subfamily
MPDWDEILARDGPAVWGAAYRITGNYTDADDCFQEAFLAAWEVARQGPVKNWPGLLKRIVATRAIDRLRRRFRQGPHETVANWDAVRGPTSSASQTIEEAELSAQLRDALAQLPAKQAECFCLHVLEEWSYAEIAEHMEESIDAVGVLLHRARKRLRILLSKSMETL